MLSRYNSINDIPEKYINHLKDMGSKNGEMRTIFFTIPSAVLDTVIVTENDIPVSWGIMVKIKESFKKSYKHIMLFTKESFRCKGYAKQIYSVFSKTHKKFETFRTRHNVEFFQKMGAPRNLTTRYYSIVEKCYYTNTIIGWI